MYESTRYECTRHEGTQYEDDIKKWQVIDYYPTNLIVRTCARLRCYVRRLISKRICRAFTEVAGKECQSNDFLHSPCNYRCIRDCSSQFAQTARLNCSAGFASMNLLRICSDEFNRLNLLRSVNFDELNWLRWIYSHEFARMKLLFTQKFRQNSPCLKPTGSFAPISCNTQWFTNRRSYPISVRFKNAINSVPGIQLLATAPTRNIERVREFRSSRFRNRF